MERLKYLGDKVAFYRRRGTAPTSVPVKTLDDDAALAELEGITPSSDITELPHVRTTANKRATEESAIRTPCPDFHRFKPLFESVQLDLCHGARITRRIRKDAGILKADVKVDDFLSFTAKLPTSRKSGNQSKHPTAKTIFCCAPCSAPSTRSKPAAVFPSRAPARSTLASPMRTILQVAPSMCYAANTIIL